jgi:hypothetical protein
MVTNMNIGSKWTWQGALGPHGHAGRPHKGAARGARWPGHVTDQWELLQKQFQASIQCRFDQWPRLDGLGSMGPLSYTWEPTSAIGSRGGGMESRPVPP